MRKKSKKKGRRNYRQCTACEIPGEKVQIDVKVVLYYCIRGKLRRNEKSLYQWAAIDECTRVRYVHIFEEHTIGRHLEKHIYTNALNYFLIKMDLCLTTAESF